MGALQRDSAVCPRNRDTGQGVTSSHMSPLVGLHPWEKGTPPNQALCPPREIFFYRFSLRGGETGCIVSILSTRRTFYFPQRRLLHAKPWACLLKGGHFGDLYKGIPKSRPENPQTSSCCHGSSASFTFYFGIFSKDSWRVRDLQSSC